MTAPPQLKLFADQRKVSLPEGEYIIFYAPCISHTMKHDPLMARRAINVTLGLITAIAGKNTFLDHLGDQIIIPASNQVSHYSDMFKIPLDDDFLYFEQAEPLQEILEHINTMPEDQRGRVLYIVEMFGRAVRQREPEFQFSLYWIALELVAQTKGDGLAAKLANTYSKPKMFAYDTLEFRAVYDARHNYFHKGFRPSLSSRQERLVQCYFLDLLRARLHLVPRHFSLAALQAWHRQAQLRSLPQA